MKRTKPAPIAAVVLALVIVGAMLMAGVADAQKKKTKTFNRTKIVNAPIPDASPDPPAGTGINGILKSTINVPKKKYKGKTVAFSTVKVTVTIVGADPDSAQDISLSIQAPNGRTVPLTGGFVGQNIGPLTFTPNSPSQFCHELADPCGDPNAIVRPPYIIPVGDVQLAFFGGIGMPGNWTLEVQDTGSMPNRTSVLVNWALSVKPAKTTTS